MMIGFQPHQDIINVMNDINNELYMAENRIKEKQHALLYNILAHAFHLKNKFGQLFVICNSKTDKDQMIQSITNLKTNFDIRVSMANSHIHFDDYYTDLYFYTIEDVLDNKTSTYFFDNAFVNVCHDHWPGYHIKKAIELTYKNNFSSDEIVTPRDYFIGVADEYLTNIGN